VKRRYEGEGREGKVEKLWGEAEARNGRDPRDGGSEGKGRL
jgi:hypothetical protein